MNQKRSGLPSSSSFVSLSTDDGGKRKSKRSGLASSSSVMSNLSSADEVDENGVLIKKKRRGEKTSQNFDKSVSALSNLSALERGEGGNEQDDPPQYGTKRPRKSKRLSTVTTNSQQPQPIEMEQRRKSTGTWASADIAERKFIKKDYIEDHTFWGVLSNFVELDTAPIWNEISEEDKTEYTALKMLWTGLFYTLMVVLLLVVSLIFPVGQILFNGYWTGGGSGVATTADNSTNSTNATLIYEASSGLSGLTVGLIQDVFNFLWKYVVCLYVLPKTLSRWETIIFAILGSCIHISIAVIVRLPIYILASEIISLLDQVVTQCSYLGVYHLFDFVVIPILFYKLNEYRGAESVKVKSRKQNSRVFGLWLIVITVYLWLVVWVSAIAITSFYPPAVVNQWSTMTMALWIPAGPVICVITYDFMTQSRRFSFAYVVSYLFLVEMIPQVAGSYIAKQGS